MEDSPPPQDAKLLERLKPLDPELTKEMVEDYNNKIMVECENLSEFYNRIGISTMGLCAW